MPTPRKVIITSRSLERANKAISSLKGEEGYNPVCSFSAFELDVSSPSSTIAFAERVSKENDYLDVLVNNAGLALDRYLPELEDVSLGALQKRTELFQETLCTNVIGPDILTAALLPLLSKSAKPRLIFISSGLGSMGMNADPSSSFAVVKDYMYRASKAALNMLMQNWHRELRDKGFKVYGICPGFNATLLGGDAEAAAKLGATDPSVGGSIIADVILDKRAGEEGLVVGGGGKVRPW